MEWELNLLYAGDVTVTTTSVLWKVIVRIQINVPILNTVGAVVRSPAVHVLQTLGWLI
jgi:hypothetical protein